MRDQFGTAALGLQGVAARLLGWRPGDFWEATPAELNASLSLNDRPAGFGRDELNTLMERDNGNYRQ